MNFQRGWRRLTFVLSLACALLAFWAGMEALVQPEYTLPRSFIVWGPTLAFVVPYLSMSLVAWLVAGFTKTHSSRYTR